MMFTESTSFLKQKKNDPMDDQLGMALIVQVSLVPPIMKRNCRHQRKCSNYVIKVSLKKGRGYQAGAIEAISYAVNGAHVINASWVEINIQKH